MTTIERIRASAAEVHAKWTARVALGFLGASLASVAMQADLDAYNARREAAYAAAFEAEYGEELSVVRARQSAPTVIAKGTNR